MENNIEPEELRIGNLVNFRGKTVEVQALSKLHIKIWCEEKLRIRWVAMRDVQRIELSEEWLKSLGFREVYSTTRSGLEIIFSPRMRLWFNEGNYAEMDLMQDGKHTSFKHSHVKYVHELQNFFFSLSKEELKLDESVLPVKSETKSQSA